MGAVWHQLLASKAPRARRWCEQLPATLWPLLRPLHRGLPSSRGGCGPVGVSRPAGWAGTWWAPLGSDHLAELPVEVSAGQTHDLGAQGRGLRGTCPLLAMSAQGRGPAGACCHPPAHLLCTPKEPRGTLLVAPLVRLRWE